MPGFIATSIIDLFLFIRTIRIPISLEKSRQRTILHRLQNLVRGESNLTKVGLAILFTLQPLKW